MRLAYYKEKLKYTVAEPFEWKLQQRYTFPKGEFDNGYHYLVKKEDGWYVGAHVGCRWDGVTMWFDSKFLFRGSLVHDILHWLIRDGYIAEEDNYRIDAEFELVNLYVNRNYPWWKGGRLVKTIRARLARRATNLAYQKKNKNWPKVKVIE